MAVKYLCRCRLEAWELSKSVLFAASWVTIFVATSMFAAAELPDLNVVVSSSGCRATSTLARFSIRPTIFLLEWRLPPRSTFGSPPRSSILNATYEFSSPFSERTWSG